MAVKLLLSNFASNYSLEKQMKSTADCGYTLSSFFARVRRFNYHDWCGPARDVSWDISAWKWAAVTSNICCSL